MAELKRRKLIMDVDTGADDAVALILSLMSPELEVIGMTSVNGNREVYLTTLNTLRVKELVGAKAPVYKGCEYPLVATLLPGRKPNIPWREGEMAKIDPIGNLVHDDHLELPWPTIKEEPIPAPVWIVDALMASEEKVVLCPVGPLTNIAMAMSIEPRIADKIDEIMIMGAGHVTNNSSAVSEYNIWVDPEAAEIVQQFAERHKIKLTWVPLDATHEAYLTVEDAAEIRAIGTPVAEFVAHVIEKRTKGYSRDADMAEYGGAPVHDALAVLALLDPTVLQDVRAVNCHIDIGAGYSDAETALDLRERTNKDAPNCFFAFHADRLKFKEMIVNILKRNEVWS
ncbi:MAG: nucleoside hydrolase [Oscillospiraceae bacterium]|nr:nucleoside hydrolase [Oscillospiraceae bacterium]